MRLPLCSSLALDLAQQLHSKNTVLVIFSAFGAVQDSWIALLHSHRADSNGLIVHNLTSIHVHHASTHAVGTLRCAALRCAALRCTVHYALCMHYALCTMHYAPCTMHYALCTMLLALCSMHGVICTATTLDYLQAKSKDKAMAAAAATATATCTDTTKASILT